MICVSVSVLSKHNMSVPASSSMEMNRNSLYGTMKHRRSADPHCEEEGLRCNPSSSDVFIAAEEIGEGLGVWRACLPTPRGNMTHNHAQQGSLDMHIESFVRCPTNDNFTFSTHTRVT